MNPYASRWHRSILAAYLRRVGGPERNPERAARIACRFDRVLRWSKAVGCDGEPVRNSWWRRKLTGYLWRVTEGSSMGAVRVVLKMDGVEEYELYDLPKFLDYFEPEP